MTRQDDLHTLLKDLLMMRAELEAMDVSRGGWEAALKQRHLRQQRHDLEDALQERMAELGSMMLDALMERREDALLSSARGPLGLVAIPPQDEPTLDDEPAAPIAQGEAQRDEESPPSEQALVTEAELPASLASASEPPLTDEPTLDRAKILSTPDIDPASIAQLKSKMISNSLGFDDDSILDSVALTFIKQAWELAGATPAELKSKSNVRRELSAVEGLVEQRSKWRLIPNTPHLELCCWLVARLRALEQALALDFSNRVEDMERLKALYPKMIHHVRALDYVHGLSPKHSPRYGQWRDDARVFERMLRQRMGHQLSKTSGPSFNLDDCLRCLTAQVREGASPAQFIEAMQLLQKHKVTLHKETRVVNLAMNFVEELSSHKSFKRLRNAAQAQLNDAKRQAEEGEEQSALLEDWPWLEHTLGKRCALIGGEPKPHRRSPLMEAFGFEELEWYESNPRQVQSLIERIKGNSFQMVIVLRAWCAHRVSDPLFALRKSGAVPDFKLVQADAYGVQQLRAGIERYLQPL